MQIKKKKKKQATLIFLLFSLYLFSMEDKAAFTPAENFWEQVGVSISPTVLAAPHPVTQLPTDQCCCRTIWCDTHVIWDSFVLEYHCRSLISGSAEERYAKHIS